MIPKFLHQTSKSVAWEERVLTQKARSLMPEWQYKMWGDDDNQALFESVFPQYLNEYLQLPMIARTDIARCLYLYVHGGVYFDTDFRFFKPLDDAFCAHECVLGIESLEFNDADVDTGERAAYKIGNAFMASSAGFELWPRFLEDTFRRFKEGERRVLYLAGPHALSVFLSANKDIEQKVTIVPGEMFFPDFRLAKMTAVRGPTTVGVHLCWGGWRNKPLLQQVKNRGRRLLSAALAFQDRF